MALLAPAAIVGLTLGYLGRPEASEGAADVPPMVATCVRMVERSSGEVVVVGNSKSGSDIDRPALARALGVKAIAQVGLPGSSAPLWYAALDRCVFEEGHRPKLVVVYATAGSMLRTTLDSERERLALAPFLGESEPVLDRKVFGGEPASPFWQRVGTRKTQIQLGFQHGIRDIVAGLFFAPAAPGGVLAAGRAYAEPALEKVLGADAGAEAVRRHRAIPIAEAGAGSRPAGDATVADTLVPDLVELAQAHGARILFVQAPVSTAQAGAFDSAAPDLVRQMVVSLNEHGAAYLDLTGLDIPASAYGDAVHMNATGRGLLTTALAARLAEIDALGSGPFARAQVPRAPATLGRSGAPPTVPTAGAPTRGASACGWQLSAKGLEGVSDGALSRLGAGAVSPLVLYEDGAPLLPHAAREAFDQSCAGGFNHQGAWVKFSPTGGPADVAAGRAYTFGLSEDVPLRGAAGREAWWVYPGTSLRADVGEGWEGAVEGFAVRVEAIVAVGGAAPATFAWEGRSAALEPGGSAVSATLAGAAPAGPWSVEVRSPADGPWLLVRRVVAGTEAAPWHLVGDADTGHAADFLKGEATVAAAPPDIGTLGKIEAMKEGVWRFDTSALTAPDAEAIAAVSGINRCSPVRIAEDGVPLAVPNIGVPKLAQTAGAYAHTAAGILFTTSDRTAPDTNGRTYTASLDAARTCLRSRWLYPGDAVRFRLGAPQLRELEDGATHLQLTAVALGGADPAAAMTARLFVAGVEVSTQTVPMSSLGAAPLEWPLAAPIPPDDADVVVELSTPAGAPYALVTALSLTEPPKPAFPDAYE
ncbi:MAG: hypothetical protein Q8P18_13815 [Pseudomonadota bacterium]|nr:hypothetical protein [Pseudomonadota bacterium]